MNFYSKVMLTYNTLSFYLQLVINLTLLTGLIVLVMNDAKSKIVLLVFLFGELLLELSDYIDRLLDLHTINIYNYPLSQFFGILMITAIYDRYFFSIGRSLKVLIGIFAVLSLVFNIVYMQNIQSATFYSNIITSIIVSSFAAYYFLYMIKKGNTRNTLFVTNILVFLFFSVECLISTTFNFLINNYLEWVAPIWLFRGVLLLSFYISFINLGWHTRTMKVR
ncbi:hypothetical protein [Chryseobacterium pennipullorum]|uniref:YhhN-like protein n=1 Tax=Chryseobacterium pennipullorum TaxID=2258963 RepID=A0A3D9AS73_9FLAO|nr:hypothetical protein [Chryseobacterium pennipullorum]REC44180.1 hypothetical protein DRF67_17785 [Chryseobacterium pennipullorum]